MSGFKPKRGPGRPFVPAAEEQKRRNITLDDDRADWVARTQGNGNLSLGLRRLIDDARRQEEAAAAAVPWWLANVPDSPS